MDDEQKEVVFKKWMKNVHGIEPEFYVKISELYDYSKVDDLSFKDQCKFKNMFLRGMSDEYYTHVLFKLKNGIGTISNLYLGDFINGYHKLTSFHIFCKLMYFCKKRGWTIMCHKYNLGKNSIEVFASYDLSFEEMQIKVDLGGIDDRA